MDHDKKNSFDLGRSDGSFLGEDSFEKLLADLEVSFTDIQNIEVGEIFPEKTSAGDPQPARRREEQERAAKANSSLADTFGKDDEPESPPPSFQERPNWFAEDRELQKLVEEARNPLPAAPLSNDPPDSTQGMESGECIELRFILEEDEVKSALVSVGVYKSVGLGQWVLSALLLLVAGITVNNIFNDSNYLPMGIVFLVFYLLLGTLLWVVPAVGLGRRARAAVDGITTIVRVYDDRVESSKEGGETASSYELASSNFSIKKDLYLLKLKNDQLLVIPSRVVPTDRQEELKRRLNNEKVLEKQA